MTARINHRLLVAREEIVEAPARRACDDRSFEMPAGIYVAMALMLAGFVSVLSFGFMGPTMVIPFAICIIFISAFFAVPTIFVRTGPDELRTRALDWQEFSERGIATATGRTPAGEAATLALLLPFLILCWAVAVVIIAAVA